MMMNMSRHGLLVAILMAFGAGPVRATELGDPAPPLNIASWVQGHPVDLAKGKGKNIFVIEFWATWCAPCVKNIPHLTAMQKKLKDKGVVFIGVTQEPALVVSAFVKRMGSKMDYTVASDDQGKTSNAYMGAFGLRGIPCYFVVDKRGWIAWYGYPAEELDAVLERMVAGTYDLDAVVKEAQLIKRATHYFTICLSGKTDKKTAALGHQFVTDAATNKKLLNMFANFILTYPKLKHRDVKLALRASQLAYELSGGKDPSVNETYARSLFDTGDVTRAIELQKLAVKYAPAGRFKTNCQKVLKHFERQAARTATSKPAAPAK